jgi:hypothetical protein
MGVTLILAFLVILPMPTARACTLWGATGAKVIEKGTLIAKNRDNTRNLTTELRFVSRKQGFRFMGLFDPEKDGYVVSGINEKGLTVVNASAASLSEEKRNVAKEDLTDRILTSFESVDGILAEKALFVNSYPAFYMVADAGKMALIEVAPAGKVSVKVTDEGILTHTNHYVDENLSGANERGASGSRKRLDRINHMLGGRTSAFTMEQFIALSEDGKGIQNDAIRQTCGTGRKVCTLASWVAFLPKQGSPLIYVKIERPDGTFAMQRFMLDPRFWGQTSQKLIP